MTRSRGGNRNAGRFGGLLAVVIALAALTLAFGSHAAPVSVTVLYSSVPVADADLDGYPNTGDWGGSSSTTIPLENGAASPYGSATLYAKHDGTYMYRRIDGSMDVSWTSAGGNHFWLGVQVSPTGTSHHGSGTWDGIFFGLWDGTDYAPQPAYPPTPVDTNGFSRPPAKDASQDDTGAMRYSGSAAPYSFTAEWKKKLNTGDASDLSYAADGTTTYNFFVTTDSNGRGSSGGTIDHSTVTNLNTMRFALPSGPNTPPTVNLTRPDGGEDWTGGSSHLIGWNMSDAETPTASLKAWINYSTDGGLSYAPVSGAQGLTGLANPCSFAWTLPGVTTTQARVRVTVLDAKSASAVDASLADFTIDSTVPSVTAFSPVDGTTGVSTTTEVRVTFSEGMNRNSAQQAFSLRRVDTGAYVGGSFAWSGNDLLFTPSGALAGGVVYRAQVNATALDASDPGNPTGTVSAASFTTVDLSPPTISGVSAIPSPQEAGGRVNVSASVTDNGVVSGVWIEITAPGGGLVGNFTASYDSISRRFFTEAAYDQPGTYGFRISAMDAAGNWAVTAGAFTIVDTTSPTIQHVPVTQALMNGPIHISALVTDVDAVADARVDYTDILGFRSNVSMALVGSLYEFDIPGQSQLGTLTYFLWAIDPSGNTARTPTYSVSVVEVDATPPTIANVVATPALQDAGRSVNISADVSDNIAVQSVYVEVRDPQGQVLGNVSMVRSGATDRYYYEQTYSALGVHRFILWAVDGSGNPASASGSFEIVDRLAPVFEWVSVTPLTSEAGQAVNISASVTDNLAVAGVDIAVRDTGGNTLLTGTLTGSSSLRWTVASFRTLGNLSFTLTARDAAGNAATYDGNFTVVDTEPPVAIAGADTQVWVGSTVTFDASASHDNSAIVSITWSFTYNGSSILLYGPVASFAFDLVGEYNVSLTVVDAAGLVSTAKRTVTVTTDTTPPLSPTNIAVIAAASSCLEVTWQASSSTDVAGYQVYRWNVSGSSFDLLATLDANATSFEDCGLAADTTYSYWVLAVDLYGNRSPPSPIESARTSGPSASAESAVWIYQVVIGILLVAAVVLVALWAGKRKRNVPPGTKPR